MPSETYYREQARLLLLWARETSDPLTAARLEARARELLAQANLPDEPAVGDLNPLIDEFNDQQLGTRRLARQQQQQQQQAQPKQDDKD